MTQVQNNQALSAYGLDAHKIFYLRAGKGDGPKVRYIKSVEG